MVSMKMYTEPSVPHLGPHYAVAKATILMLDVGDGRPVRETHTLPPLFRLPSLPLTHSNAPSYSPNHSCRSKRIGLYEQYNI